MYIYLLSLSLSLAPSWLLLIVVGLQFNQMIFLVLIVHY
jgi:hypothetical protein